MARRLHRYVENQGWNLIYHPRIENMARRGGIEPPSSIQLLYYQLRRLVLGHSATEKLNRVSVLR